jgi:hypothetical protein
MDITALKLELDRLHKENLLLIEEKRKLQEDVGRWRRMAQEKKAKPEYLKERHDQGRHFIDIKIKDIPADMNLKDALAHIRTEILPVYYPYHYHAAYRSKKYGWVATLLRPDNTDMN